MENQGEGNEKAAEDTTPLPNESFGRQEIEAEENNTSSLGEADLQALRKLDEKEKRRPRLSFFSTKGQISQKKSKEDKNLTIAGKQENDNLRYIDSNSHFPPKPRLHPSEQALSTNGNQHGDSSLLDSPQLPTKLPEAQNDLPVHQYQDTLSTSEYLHGRPAILDFVPLPMPLPIAPPGLPNPAVPGVFQVSGDGITTARHRYESEQDEVLEMVDLAEQVERLGGPGVAQAWPVIEPVSRAAPYQGYPETHGGIFNPTQGYKKALLVSIVAGFVAILASSVSITMFFPKDPNKARHMKMESTIMDAFGKDYFDNIQKEKALRWILYEDPRNELSATDDGSSLIQRFSLVSFYFQTSAHRPWIFCNPPAGLQSETCYHRTDPSQASGARGTRWLTAAHECKWMGVFCAGRNMRVTEVTIANNNVSGTFPGDELAVLTHLEKLDLRKNNLAGSLPASTFKGIPFEWINLGGNKLTGSIPFQIFLLPTITVFDLSQNQITGPIPTQIGLLRGADLFLHLFGNLLTGSIPEQIYKTQTLQDLNLDNNLLTGTLSSSLGLLTRSASFRVAGNPIQGSMPTQIGLTKFTSLALDGTNMNGTIPEELYQNKDLTYLWWSGCNIAGTISTRVGQLKDLRLFQLANNNLHGTIPKEIASVAKTLESLHLQGNPYLTGSIPDLFCSQLHRGCKVAADCKPIAATGVPSLYCPDQCCSICCDAESKICLEH